MVTALPKPIWDLYLPSKTPIKKMIAEDYSRIINTAHPVYKYSHSNPPDWKANDVTPDLQRGHVYSMMARPAEKCQSGAVTLLLLNSAHECI